MGAMASILLQAGHAAWRSRSGRSYPAHGGAPGEAQWCWDLAHLIAARLAAHGVGTTIVGQWYDLPVPPEAAEPAALFIALHYDAAVYGEGGCFADGRRYQKMPAYPGEFITGWEATYPVATGIALRNGRRNENTALYYAYAGVTNAPAALLEHGCGSPVPVGVYPAGQDWRFLHQQIELGADADAAAILAYLIERGLLPAEETEDMGIIDELNRQVADLKREIEGLHGVTNQLAKERDYCQELKQQIEGELRAALEQVTGERDTLTKEVAALTEALANAPTSSGRPIHVTVMTEDSTEFEFVPVA
jgi:hypothetical protein